MASFHGDALLFPLLLYATGNSPAPALQRSPNLSLNRRAHGTEREPRTEEPSNAVTSLSRGSDAAPTLDSSRR